MPESYEPVHVHVASVAAGAQLGGAAGPAKAKATRFGTETVDNTNPVRPLLPEHDGRICAWIQATGGDVYMCDSESKAIQADGATNSNEGTFLPHTNTAPWPVYGDQSVWIAQATAGTTCVVSFTAEYETGQDT